MKLESYLRNDFANYLRPLLIKDKCSNCGDTNNLELHHEKQFSQLLEETLNILDLKHKDTKDYTLKELELIKNIILGKQIQIGYITLCSNCHGKIKTIKKESLIKALSKYNNMDLSNLAYYKCINPKKAFKQLEKEYCDNEITLNDLIIECIDIGYLHPNSFRSIHPSYNK